MLNYKDLQKVLSHLNKCIGHNWHNLTIKDVEYFDEEDYGIKTDIYFDDIIVIDCVTKINNNNIYFSLTILNNKDRYHIYISYIPGNNKLLHNILVNRFYNWNSEIGGYLLFDSDITKIETDNKLKSFIKSLDDIIKRIDIANSSYM